MQKQNILNIFIFRSKVKIICELRWSYDDVPNYQILY